MKNIELLFTMLGETTMLAVLHDIEAITKDCEEFDLDDAWGPSTVERNTIQAMATETLQERINGRGL